MEGLDDLLGQSAAIQAIRDNVRRLLARPQAGRRLPAILIQGETGTGKGLMARLIHRHGPRAGGPFVDVNCAAIPETLLEAELFGFERGAFTDARRAKPGLFQTAHRGTIFLDEVGLLPDSLQAKLLKVLEEQAVRRLGSIASEPVDVWIISATNADLQAAIAARRFREDLYHRLAVLTLQLPPLRERGRDVVLLAERFLARACADYGLPPKTFSPEAQGRLLAYSWPGNVRELANIIERVALLAEDAVVNADVLEIPSIAPSAQASGLAEPAAPASLEAAMREHLLAALTQTGWNISRTAALLGISRNTLRARIEKFGLRSRSTATRPHAPLPGRTPLPAPSVAEPRPLAYVSAAPAATATAAPSAIRWEGRRVTLLRARLITAEGDEEVPDTSRALDVLLDKVRSFGGRVEEMSPRGIGAAFGIEPVEDAPRRAAHAAMAIEKAAERGRKGDGEPFAVKIGIHVGQVLVGQSGARLEIAADSERAQWTVLDSLLASAGPDGILVSAAAAPFLDRRFDLTAEPSPAGTVYRLRGRERKGLAVEGEMAWFVGRRQELDLLKSRLASARAGHGQIVGIVGEAGIGKSRLLYEFRQALRGEAITYLEGHCLSYGSTIPYLPVLEILRHACRITDADAPDTVIHKLRMNLQHLGIEPDKALPYLLQFLGIKEGTEALDSANPQAVRLRTFRLLREMCISASRQRPLIIAVEDMHWVDAASETLGALVESLDGVPLLLVVTYRPGYRPPWLERSHMTQIALQPLSAEDSLSVLGRLLPSAQLSGPIPRLILSKAEGNPFFLEELARAVQEQGDSFTGVAVPDTVEEVLLARINRLPDRERRLLECAAVIGKNVSVDVLRVLAELPEHELSEAFGHLRAADFLYEESTEPEVRYSFKHALTHEVAYGSLRPERRREMHAWIVDAIERVYPDRVSEHAEPLAHHALRAEVWEKAVAYSRQAGRKALARSANREASAYFEQALTALAHQGAERESLEQDIDIRFELRTALTPLGELERIFDYLREAETIAENLGDRSRLGRVSAYLADHYRLAGNPERAIEAGRRALTMAEAQDDFTLQVVAHTYLGQVYYAVGDYRRASEAFGKNVRQIGPELIRESFELAQLPAIHSRAWQALCLAPLGEFPEAIALGQEALELCHLVEHPASQTAAHMSLGGVYLVKGDFQRAIPILATGLEISRQWSIQLWLPWLASSLGTAYAFSDRAAEAVPLLEEAVDRAISMQRLGALSARLTALGEAYLLAGRPEEAGRKAADALDLARKHKERGHEAHALRLLAEVAAHRNPPDVKEGEARYREALSLAAELGMRPASGLCHLGLGRLLRRAGEPARARAELEAARAVFRRSGMGFWLEQAETESRTIS